MIQQNVMIVKQTKIGALLVYTINACKLNCCTIVPKWESYVSILCEGRE